MVKETKEQIVALERSAPRFDHSADRLEGQFSRNPKGLTVWTAWRPGSVLRCFGGVNPQKRKRLTAWLRGEGIEIGALNTAPGLHRHARRQRDAR